MPVPYLFFSLIAPQIALGVQWSDKEVDKLDRLCNRLIDNGDRMLALEQRIIEVRNFLYKSYLETEPKSACINIAHLIQSEKYSRGTAQLLFHYGSVVLSCPLIHPAFQQQYEKLIFSVVPLAKEGITKNGENLGWIYDHLKGRSAPQQVSNALDAIQEIREVIKDSLALIVEIEAMIDNKRTGVSKEVVQDEVDKNSGLYIPETLGTLKRTAIIDNETEYPGLGTTVYYNMLGLKATVYIYNEGNKSISDGIECQVVRNAFARAKLEIEQASQLVGYGKLTSPIFSAPGTIGSGENQLKVLKATFSKEGKPEEVSSHLYVFGIQNQIIKLRLSHLKQAEKMIGRFRDGFLNAVSEWLIPEDSKKMTEHRDRQMEYSEERITLCANMSETPTP